MQDILQIIPAHEQNRFGLLTDEAKKECCRIAGAVLDICGQLQRRAAKVSHAVHSWAVKLDMSPSHVRRKLDEWRKTGDWKVFVNKSLAGPDWWDTDRQPMPEEFLDFWFALRGENQRQKCRPQHRKLLRQLADWRRGDLTKKIPGFDTPPANAEGKDHPPGWSYETLQGIKPRKAEMALMTLGIAAAMKFLPPIPGTRVGARFLEYVTIDDVWQDRKINVPGYGVHRLLQMGGMDYSTAVYLKFGLRPELPTDDGRRERLKERDAMELIAMILWEFGYPRDYDMHLICERGTATIRAAEAKALYDLSNGRIKVCYTSMEGGLVLVWQESKTGNSRGKGYHESWHNLFHNEMATLPGQVGKDNAHQPAALLGMEREAKSLITASHFLTDEQKRRLRMPFSDLEKAHWETLEVVKRINHRRDHECEGFDQLAEWIIPGVQEIPQPEGKLALLAPCDLERVVLKYRVETPWERLVKLRSQAEFNRVPEWILPRLYADWHAKRPIVGGRFAFDKQGKNYIFKPATLDQQLPESKQEYLGYCNPVDPEVVHLTDESGAFVGTWVRERGIQRGDHKAVAEAIAEKTRLLNTSIATVRRVNREYIAEQDRRLRENNEVLAEAGLLAAPASAPQGNEVATPGAIALNNAVHARNGAILREAMAPNAPAPEAAKDCTEELLKRETNVSELVDD